MSAALVGRFTPEQKESLRLALTRGGLEVRSFADGTAAGRALRQPASDTPKLIIADAAMVELASLLETLRSHPRLVSSMVLAAVPTATADAFLEAFAMGVDDVVVASDGGGVTRRAASLQAFDPTARPALTEGPALIAHPSMQRRRALGRTLRAAGYDVGFAETGEELAALASRGEPPTIAVASESLEPHGAIHAVLATRRVERCGELPVIVVGTRGELRQLGSEAESFHRVALTDENAPPENLLFVANELLRPGVKNLRASARVLYNALAAFRPAGQLQATLGVSYNVSRDGLYIRTLDPPKRGEMLWLELAPPGARNTVHLRGEVVWVRRVEKTPGGAAPAGFAIRLKADACPTEDLAAWQAGYETLTERPRLVA